MKTTIYPGARIIRSTNQGHRSKPCSVGLIHYDGSASARGNMRYMAQWTGLSYHVDVARDGFVYQSVPFNRVAKHAGITECRNPDTGETEGDLNAWSVGIAVSNRGLLHRQGGRWWFEAGGGYAEYEGPEPVEAALLFDGGRHVVEGFWEPYTEAQIRSTVDLCRWLLDEGWVKKFVGHEETAMPFAHRKFDPGPLFFWDRLTTELGDVRISPRTEGTLVVADHG